MPGYNPLEHVKIDLFPDSVYVFTPKSTIIALPRGATALDFAYTIHTGVGDHAVSARINHESAPLKTELRNGDIVAIDVSDDATIPTTFNFESPVSLDSGEEYCFVLLSNSLEFQNYIGILQVQEHQKQRLLVWLDHSCPNVLLIGLLQFQCYDL